MIPLFEPGNLMLFLFLCLTLGLPLAALAWGIFFMVRYIPLWPAQILVPLVAGIILSVVYSSVDPSNPEKFGVLLFVTGMLIHPLLILPPVIVMQKYLRRIPVLCGVFFAAFVSLCFILIWSAAQGDMRYDPSVNFVWQSIVAVVTDLVAASIGSGLILGLDRFKSGRQDS
jgi:hypothetical protein